jgi:hypothetical protein
MTRLAGKAGLGIDFQNAVLLASRQFFDKNASAAVVNEGFIFARPSRLKHSSTIRQAPVSFA